MAYKIFIGPSEAIAISHQNRYILKIALINLKVFEYHQIKLNIFRQKKNEIQILLMLLHCTTINCFNF